MTFMTVNDLGNKTLQLRCQDMNHSPYRHTAIVAAWRISHRVASDTNFL
jgi:hypothetical protein